MADDPLTWSEAHSVLTSLGNERHLAAWIEVERRKRGWSQERLAKEMTDAGCPLPQSAISKIEKPASGGRRAITVEEAIAFSKVFDVPLVQLLLPAHSLTYANTLKGLADGPLRLTEALVARTRYRALLNDLAANIRPDTALKAILADQLEEALASASDAVDSLRVQFLTDLHAELQGQPRDLSTLDAGDLK